MLFLPEPDSPTIKTLFISQRANILSMAAISFLWPMVSGNPLLLIISDKSIEKRSRVIVYPDVHCFAIEPFLTRFFHSQNLLDSFIFVCRLPSHQAKFSIS